VNASPAGMIKISFRNNAFVDMTGSLHQPADNQALAGPSPGISLICLIKHCFFGCRTIGKILSHVNAFFISFFISLHRADIRVTFF
jgi:hypothetical protein